MLRVGKIKDAFHKNLEKLQITIQNPGEVLDNDYLNMFLYNGL